MPHLSDTIWHVPLFLTYFPLVSESLVPSMLLQRHHLFLFIEWLTVYRWHIFFNPFTVYMRWGCFHVLAILNSTAMNISPGIILNYTDTQALSQNLKVGPKNQCFAKLPRYENTFLEQPLTTKFIWQLTKWCCVISLLLKPFIKMNYFLEWLMILLSIWIRLGNLRPESILYMSISVSFSQSPLIK